MLTGDDVAARYGYDAETATSSPVYALVPQFADPDDAYARHLLAARCLDGVVEYRVVPPGSTTDIVDPRTLQLIFTVEVAESQGYPYLRHDPAAAVSSGVPGDVEITDEVHAAMVACGAEADERLGRPPEVLLNDIEAAGWEAVEDDEAVRTATDAWVTCMAPAGVVDLPSDPHEMPPPSVVGGAVHDDLDPRGSVALSDREREVAVADARCREQVGLQRAELLARARAELAAIGRDVAAFDAVREEYVQYQAGVDEVIAQRG